MTKMLITGGAGFIGTNFVKHIVKKYDYDLVVLDKLTYAGNINNLWKEIENDDIFFIKGDICDKELVNDLCKDVDIIVHFAAESHVYRSIASPKEFINTNVIGTYTLLEAAREYDIRFHHISTDEVFGELGKKGYFNESTPYNPHSPYSASKASSDHLVRAYHDTYGVRTTISNCSNNYGPYQYPEKLIPLFITNLIDGKKLPVYGTGLNVRDWIHVQDHVEAVDLIIHEGKIGETYCVGGDAERTNMDITKDLLNLFNEEYDKIKYVKDRKGHDFRYAIDSSKMKKELKWKPRIEFSEGMQDNVIWYIENNEWWRDLKDE